MSIIDIKNMSYVYPSGQRALRSIDINIGEGEFVAVIGQNGAGKSTLMKTMTGLLKPTEGEVCIEGKGSDEYTMARLSTRVGYVLQNPDRQLFSNTVREEIAFGPRNLGVTGEELEKRVDETMKSVGIGHLAEEYPPSLSKGDRARVAIASVMAMNTKILILDEPTGGQDFEGRYQIMDIVRELNRQGYTIIIVTHAMSLVAEYAGRVIVLCEGEVLIDSDSRSVFSRPDLLRQTFICPPQVVELSRELYRESGSTAIELTVDDLADAILRKMQ
ncbi:MAG: ATP-binding cassette domain-containing protein [Spirochaetales bacterium]|nr:ATP-binding cassette domain-containing protein [Spirochaetales bacterium]